MQLHFAPPLAEEFTGTPETTRLVIVREDGRAHDTALEVVDSLSPAVRSMRYTGGAEPTDDEIRSLLTDWARTWDLDTETTTPAWVFVHLATVAGVRCYAAVEPTQGAAFAHVLQAGS